MAVVNDSPAFRHLYAPALRQVGFDLAQCRLLALSPLEQTDLPLARALLRAGVSSAIDLGRVSQAWPGLLASLTSPAFAGIGLRIPTGAALGGLRLPDTIAFLVVEGDCAALPVGWCQLPVLAQVCTLAEARAALDAGVVGLIGKGQESGGRVGAESSFVLLQRLLELAEPRAVPVWCQGGIGLHTAAAAFAGGAFGVVLDALLATLPESSLADDIKAQILAMDGSEVRSVAGYQVYVRNVRENTALDAMSADDVEACLAGNGERTLLAIGQDAALARLAMAECPTLGTLIQTLRMRIAAQIHQAKTLRVLDADNAWARAHGTRYPIAQGPMTRVSDTAEFCGAVADAGALPFLALSLMKAAASRALLVAARARVGDKSWGVGVLGFAPREILDPQLELIKEFRPSAVLLAGGRPSQARPLLDLGIPTYLHVPSPGLLELFLKDGATHFVFEGRECGGHVGPRYSFVLWEQAITILQQCDHPERLHILFAGGIHDARSSAMVATMAAPLAALGAKIGVLMGTAYIATHEAVSCAAILENFQQQALAGEETVLVETAPGHAVRCLASGFVELFNREKARLDDAGVEQNEAWKTLEALTVGRLRIVTKGVDYRDGVLTPVDLHTQRNEGMYMLGQIVAMKTELSSVAELHASVTLGATEHLDRLAAPPWQRRVRVEPVAIVGMACIYPGSPDLERYWANIVEGRDLVSEVSPERWRAEQYYQAGAAASGKTPSKWGGFIDDIPFDPLKYGIPPQSLAAIEPVQLLSLAVAHDALADAGYLDKYFDREKTAVIFGAEAGMDLSNQYTFRNLYPQYCGDLPDALDAVLPKLTEDSFPGVLANVISGRIANRLGLGGVNYSVDSACASSLTAIELAVKELRTGGSDMVLAGGADFHNNINDYLMFASVGALSASGRCRSFDNSADGICLGEGVGIVVLKRLADAERDGDRIYAVIDGVAGSSDGRGLGLTAPKKDGQKRALERAYWQAGVLPAEIGLVEAHGTGTVVGDRIELQALTEVFNAGGAHARQTGLGSVKSQIGHSKCAAGIAGVIKIAKALHHRVLPPTQHIETPNDWYRRDISPFQLNRTAQPWISEHARAAVSAFGFGGTNFHAVLSAYPAHQPCVGAHDFPCELFVLRGETFDVAVERMRALDRFVVHSTVALALRDLAFSAWHDSSGPVQSAFVASDIASLRRQLAAACAHETQPGIVYRNDTSMGKVAWLFPGQGSQYPGMLGELFVYFPELQTILASSPEYAGQIYPGTAYDDATRQAQQAALTDTRQAQPALAMVEMAAFAWLSSFGLVPDMAAGHSFGELCALAAAGAWAPATLVTLARDRADAILAAIADAPDADPGSMAAVSLAADALEPLLADYPQLVLANQNSPTQTVISGPCAAVAAACAALQQHGVAVRPLATACAFHSPLVAAGAVRFAASLARHQAGELLWPVYSNTSAARHTGAELGDTLARHIANPVRFVEQIRAMHADGAWVFVEVGPRRVLSGLVDSILADAPHRCIALDQGAGLLGQFGALAELAVLMPGFNADALFAGRARALDLDAPLRLSSTTWMVNGGRAWPREGAAPAHAARVVTAPLVNLAPQAQGSPDAQQAMLAYLANMRELVNAQRDVLMAYLGEPGVAPRERAQPLPVAPAPLRSASVSIQSPLRAPADPVAAKIDDDRSVLLAIVSERTGYPPAMLDLELDLEADLSIDSIKRVEIVGELARRLKLRETLGVAADALIERLAAHKTLARMLESLAELRPVAAVKKPAPAAPALQADQLLLAIVSDSTGYPIEALDLDLDLEADLSIDSIKRLEIVSQLIARLGDTITDRDALLNLLAAQKSLRQMIARLEQHGAAPVAKAPASTEFDSAMANAASETFGAIPLTRYVMRNVYAPAAVHTHVNFRGKRFVITDDSLGLAPRVAERLQQHGAIVRIIDFAHQQMLTTDLDQIDGLVHLWTLNPDNRVRDVKRFFAMVRESLLNKTRYLLVASGLGGDFGVKFGAEMTSDFSQGAGLAGLVKSVGKEFPEIRAHCVDLDLSESFDVLAGYIEQELLAGNELNEVAYMAGRRWSREVVPMELNEAKTGDIPLAADSVVLITGGARGITARIAMALAWRCRCHFEIVGRSPEPLIDESDVTRGILDPRELRQALLAANVGLKPAVIERLAKNILAERQFRDTMLQIRAAGSSVTYTQLDVREIDAFAAFIESRYATLGRIDGVIHGAGVIEDRLLRDKTDESFERVFDTKVRGALILNKHIRDDVKFVVFFSSVAAAFGNKGQVDYASANDVLDKLAHAWQSRIDGHVLSVNWGPWADTGMVSEALEKDYARKGIGLIPQAVGVDALLRELAFGRDGGTQVVLMCGTPESFGGKA
jgi:acyl transferase domain-containing protein/NAD(P)H-dependent flavin oxidoreductase YrpB (nitropropane dioxygenase family)/NAD(P)-dependent dehydrogenase (short-subunit alcohol dehydrogenase family)